MNAMIINQHSLHLEVRLLAVLLLLELYECVLQAVARSFVSNDLA